MRDAQWWAEHGRPTAAEVFRLDWREARHWGSRPKPCRCCDNPSRLRDDEGKPCHKSCAELEVLQGMHNAQPVAGSATMARARELLAAQNREARGLPPIVRPVNATPTPASP